MYTMKQEIANNIEDVLSSDLKHLILYQKEKLIKHIAKVKGWDENELLKDFLNDSNCLENNLKDNLINIVMQETEKKKSNQSYMDSNTNILDSDTDSVKSIIVSDSSSIQSSDNQPIKKKRGRPKKINSIVEQSALSEKKRRGRPKKIVDPEKEKQKLDQPKRKRGRPKKNVDQQMIVDPNIDLEEKIDTEEDNLFLKSLDKELYLENSKQIQESVDSLFSTGNDCDSSNLELQINYENDSIYCSSDDEESEVEYEEITCDKIEYKGQQYLRDLCNNNIYSLDKENTFIGRYNENTMVIDFNAIE